MSHMNSKCTKHTCDGHSCWTDEDAIPDFCEHCFAEHAEDHGMTAEEYRISYAKTTKEGTE